MHVQCAGPYPDLPRPGDLASCQEGDADSVLGYEKPPMSRPALPRERTRTRQIQRRVEPRRQSGHVVVQPW